MAERAASAIPVPVGWRTDSREAGLAFYPPEPLGVAERAALAPLAPLGAATGLGDRILRVRSPYDLCMTVSPRGVRPVRIQRVEEEGSLSDGAFRGLVTVLEGYAQRDADRPVVQISLNIVMVTDEPCMLMLTPPFLDPSFREWPGTLVSGRFPLRSWPRALNAALEWEDRDRPWVLRRGDPLAYLWLAFDDPAKVPALVEAEITPALERHYRQISGVIEYGRNVGPMFAEAERRRPARLLTPKRLGTPPWE